MKYSMMAAMVLGLTLLSAPGSIGPAVAQETAPPGGEYQKVSALVALPDFIPGLGTLWVNPKTLPVGPFLAYDRQGKLVSTVYMIPLKDFEARKGLDNLPVAKGTKVDHVDVQFNAGHPGVAEPHYHVILWHVSPTQAASLK